MTLKVKDNFLKKDIFNNLHERMMGSFFPWYWNNGVNYGTGEGEPDSSFQFTHIFFKDDAVNSNDFEILNPFIEKLKIKKLIRIKANLLTKHHEIYEHGLHIDSHVENAKTAIFYLNDNNGYTKFETGKIVKSKSNRLVEFDACIKHTGSTVTNKKRRVVINFNYVN